MQDLIHRHPTPGKVFQYKGLHVCQIWTGKDTWAGATGESRWLPISASAAAKDCVGGGVRAALAAAEGALLPWSASAASLELWKASMPLS